MKHVGILPRLIISPIIFLLMLISVVTSAFYSWFLFIRFGGEWITYKSEKEKTGIRDIFILLQNQYKK